MPKKTNLTIVSWNVNGIRACVKKGFLEYLHTDLPDILVLQEIKAMPENLDESVLQPSGYHSVWHSAQRKGYSGVGLLTKIKPLNVVCGLGVEAFDCEGRVIMADYGKFVVFGVYFPNGQMGPHRLAYKLDFYEAFFAMTDDLIAQGRHVIICGDYNTAHRAIDLANPKENEKNSGFLPEERAWMDRLESRGYVDTFRHFYPDTVQYSWWTPRFGARSRNIGWRIDYCLVNQAFLPSVSTAFIQTERLGSDHCPVGITISVD